MDLNTQRALSSCFYLAVPLAEDTNSLRELIGICMEVEQAVDKMMKGEITPDEFLQATEDFYPDVDQYIEEVEDNLEELEKTLIIL